MSSTGVQSPIVTSKTIDDFSEQWSMFPENKGYFASLDLFRDSVAGLIDHSDVEGKTVADLGSGTGRIVEWLARLGAERIYAIEPASSLETLKSNTAVFAERISYINAPGDQFGIESEVDLAVSMGVISYIKDIAPVFRAMHKSLKPGGKFFVLAMAKEGNEFYCRFVLPLRNLSVLLPNQVLFLLCILLALPASVYAGLCKAMPLPLHEYFKSVYSKMTWHHRVMLIFDQLNPTYVEFYSRKDLEKLFRDAGFSELSFVHRHGYSWAALAKK